MRNLFASLFRSVVKLSGVFPHNPNRASQSRDRKGAVKMDHDDQSRASQSRDRKGAVNMPSAPDNPPALSPEQFHRMLEETLTANPNLARRVLMPLAGTVFPIQGGVPTALVTVLDDGNVGIGTTAPGIHRLVSRRNPTEAGEFQVRAESPDGPFVGLLADAVAGSYNPLVQAGDNAVIWGGVEGDPPQGLVIGPWSASPKGLRIDSAGNVGIGTTDRLSKLTVKGRTSFTATGTVATTASSTTVTGTNTKFTTEVGIGDRVTVVDIGQTRTVTAITDDTHLTVDSAFTTSDSSSNMTVLPSLFRADDSSGSPKVVVSDGGTLQLGAPSGPKQQSFGPEMITATTPSRRVVLWAGAAADTEAQFLLNSTGQLEWGAGGSRDQDASLLRGSGSTDGEMHFVIGGMISGTPNVYYGAFVVERSLAGGEVLRVNTIAASTNPTYAVIINNAGGSATLDIKSISSSPTIRAEQSASSNDIFAGFVTGDSNRRFEIGADGKLSWGPGNASADISLSRPSGASPQRLELSGGDLYVVTAGKGIILKSPDGTKCARISLDNTGALVTTALTCP